MADEVNSTEAEPTDVEKMAKERDTFRQTCMELRAENLRLVGQFEGLKHAFQLLLERLEAN